MDLQRYEHAKFALAEIIRSGQLAASRAAPRPEDRVAAEQPWRDLLRRLAEDRFAVVMAGRFNQGKSSLMNALLGVNRLPTGLVPLTSVITSVRYGTSERVVLEYERSAFRKEVPLDTLDEYVTERGNPGNEKRIRSAEIQLPVELLRRGVLLVDTPGLGSAILENSQTTERFVPDIDVLVLVTSYQSPVTEDELRLLTRASRSARATFVVVNKQDTVPAEHRSEILGYVERLIQEAVGNPPVRPFSLSARDGLMARERHDATTLAKSGLADFETALMRLLTSDDRSRLFLVGMCERVAAHARLLPDADIAPILGALERLRHEPGLTDGRVDAPTGDAAALRDAPDVMTGVPTRRVCDICRAVADAQFRFLSRYQYAIATYALARADHAERDGFCPLHTWHYEQVASPRGTCTAYPALLTRVAERLRRVGVTGESSETRLTALLAPRCPVCEVRRATEEEFVTAIVARLASDTETCDHGSPCCMLHLQTVISRIGDPALRSQVLVRHAQVLDRMAEDLQRYAIRHDALRRDLASKEEVDAPLHALQLLVGYKTVNAVFTVQTIV